MNYGLLGYVGGTLLSLQMIPQIIKIYRQKDASQLSIEFMMCNWIGLGSMSVYGFLNSDPPIYVPTAISLINTSILISQKCFYDYSRGTTPKIEQTEDTLYPEQFPLSFSSDTPSRSHPVDIPHLNQPLT
jgi:MtN3 and saliva related transmembrane protein